MNMKKAFEEPVMEIVNYTIDDVIATSNPDELGIDLG